jgi:hypothetical protein
VVLTSGATVMGPFGVRSNTFAVHVDAIDLYLPAHDSVNQRLFNKKVKHPAVEGSERDDLSVRPLRRHSSARVLPAAWFTQTGVGPGFTSPDSQIAERSDALRAAA